MTRLPDIPYYSLPDKFDSDHAAIRRSGPSTNHLQDMFDAVLLDFPEVGSLVYKLKELGGHAVVFGGWARDCLISDMFGYKFNPRDLDIVFDGISNDQLTSILPKTAILNIFGGAAFKSANFHIDIWALSNTFLIKKFDLEPRFEILPTTTVFSINSVAFAPAQLWKEPFLIDAGFANAVDHELIAFRSSTIPFPKIQVARAATYAAKFGYKLDRQLIEFINEICVNKAFTEVRNGILEFSQPNISEKALPVSYTHLTLPTKA